MRTTITKLTLIATATVGAAIVLPATAHTCTGHFFRASRDPYQLG
ncbi:MAG TPA: hypothetical protein VEQ67_00375 [Mycobacterium sp.]|jgi:hypothetical protein|nr:hypothetical protein [Mycobacterium sp.]